MNDDPWYQALFGTSYGQRRHPKIKLRKGNGNLLVAVGWRRTKRAAFRAARNLRDCDGERRPLRVWPLPMERHRRTCDWAYGYRGT